MFGVAVVDVVVVVVVVVVFQYSPLTSMNGMCSRVVIDNYPNCGYDW